MAINRDGYNEHPENEGEVKLDRVPPQDTDIEGAVLGMMIYDNTIIPNVRAILNLDDFYKTSHQEIASAIYDISSEGEVEVNLLSLTVELDKRGNLDQVGGVPYLDFLVEKTPKSPIGKSERNAEWLASHIKELASRRKLIYHYAMAYNRLYETTEPEPIEKIIAEMNDVGYGLIGWDEKKTLTEELDSVLEMLEGGSDFGISTGFSELDELTSGYQKGELYILAGRPGMGKTALMDRLTVNLCRERRKVMIVSLEMSIKQLLLRLLSIVGEVSYGVFKHRGAPDGEASSLSYLMPRIEAGAHEIGNWDLYIDDICGVSVEEIAARIEVQHRKNDIEIAFVDHLHLIPTNGNGHSNAEAYGHISLVLKNLAKRLEIPIVCLAQLNRGVEHRNNKLPRLSDLRESGSLEQNADNVWFLYRESYYKDAEERQQDPEEEVQLIVAKNKSLSAGKVALWFVGERMDFEEMAVNPNHPQAKQQAEIPKGWGDI